MKNLNVLVATATSLLAISSAMLPGWAGAAEAGSSKVSLPMPAVPTEKAPIGTVTTRSMTCVAVKYGDSTRYGTVDVGFENRASRDTDGDGVADAAPKWTFTSISSYFYSDEEAAACL